MRSIIVYPGHISTQMFDGFRMRLRRIFRQITADEVVDAILKHNDEDEIFIPTYTRFGSLIRTLPQSVIDALRNVMDIHIPYK